MAPCIIPLNIWIKSLGFWADAGLEQWIPTARLTAANAKALLEQYLAMAEAPKPKL
jgi:hypothetical protein